MAQLAEHVIGNDEVISSNLITSSKNQPNRVGSFVLSKFTSRQENDTKNVGMAQLAEHVIGNDDIRSLTLTAASLLRKHRDHQFESDYQLQKNPIRRIGM